MSQIAKFLRIQPSAKMPHSIWLPMSLLHKWTQPMNFMRSLFFNVLGCVFINGSSMSVALPSSWRMSPARWSLWQNWRKEQFQTMTGLPEFTFLVMLRRSLLCIVKEVICFHSGSLTIYQTYPSVGQDCCLSARDGSRLCQEKEGDCGRDSDCAGLLVCGKDNCISQFNWPVGDPGLYDYEDDCCTRKCTPQTPCTHGEVRVDISLHLISITISPGPVYL